MPGSARYLFSHFFFMLKVTQSEWKSQYAGSSLGVFWMILRPWLLLCLYAVVYLLIFRIKIKGMTSFEYVLYVFSGLIPFFMTAEGLSLGVASITGNRTIIENKIFPIDLLPPKAIILSQSTMIAGIPIVVVCSLVIGRGNWTILLLPVLWGLHILALIGILWILSLINVVFRDLQNFLQVVIMALLIASPFSYTPEMVPSSLAPLITLNPFAYYVIAYQGLIVRGELPSLFDSIFLFVFSLGFFYLGSIFFFRAKRVIVDYV